MYFGEIQSDMIRLLNVYICLLSCTDFVTLDLSKYAWQLYERIIETFFCFSAMMSIRDRFTPSTRTKTNIDDPDHRPGD